MLQPATLDVVTLDPIPQPDPPARGNALPGLLGYDVTIHWAASTAVTPGRAAR